MTPVDALKLTVPAAVPPEEPGKRVNEVPDPGKKSSFVKTFPEILPSVERTKASSLAVATGGFGSVAFGLPSLSQSAASQADEGVMF
mgnify:CR=1 FL=1